MKKFFGFFFMLSLFAGCAKEAPVNTNTSTPKDEVPAETKQVVTLFADVEQFTSESGATPQSKAIADDGFSWQEGDQIAIPATGVSGGYAIFTYDTEKGKFVYELTGSESFVDGTAYYPANSRPEGGYSSDFANADAARKGFKMTAEYTAGANSIAFHHTGAMVELHFTNVPSFATTVRVKIGEATAATVALSSPTSTVTVKVPVPAASSSTYSFALLQGENIIREVSKSATLYAGKYYDTPEIAIGHIIRVNDAVSWGSKALYIWNGSDNAFFTTGNNYPYKFNSISSNDHYIVIQPSFDWVTPEKKIGVKFQTEDGSNSTQTDGVYINRDIIFNAPSDGGLKTDYRLYPKSESLSSINVFVTKPLHFYVYNKANWENIQIYQWGWKGDTKVEPTAWGSVPWTKVNDGTTTFNNNTCKELSFGSSNLCGSSDAGGIIVGNLEVVKSDDLNTRFIGDIYIEFDGANSSITEFNDTKRISSAWPGTLVNSVSSIINNDAYYSFSESDYGQSVWVVFSENGLNQRTTWEITVNQEYDYGL